MSGGGSGFYLGNPWRSVNTRGCRVWEHRWTWAVGRRDGERRGTAWTRKRAFAAANAAFFDLVRRQDARRGTAWFSDVGGGSGGGGFGGWGGGGSASTS